MAHTYLLIGGGGGQGSAVTKRLVDRGATVVIAERNKDKAEARASDLGAEAQHCDATDFQQVEDLVARVGPDDFAALLRLTEASFSAPDDCSHPG